MSNITNNNNNNSTVQLFPGIVLMNPIVCLFGVITNSINIAVFVNPQLKDPTYRYMLCHSLSNFSYLTILVFSIMSSCGAFCETSRTFSIRVYSLVFSEYFTSSLALFSILIDINLSLQRYLIISNSRIFKIFRFKMVVPVCFAFAVAFYLPILSVYQIVPIISQSTNQTISFSLVLNSFGRTSFGRFIPIFLTCVRIFLATVVLGIVNILSANKFYRHFKLRKNRMIFPSASGNNFYFLT
jgi:hypothetical protein